MSTNVSQLSTKGDNSQDKIRLKSEFSERIAVRIAELHISQIELARQAGISKSSMGAYCQALKMPSADAAILIAKALKVRPEWLILGTGPMLDDELPNLVKGFGEARYEQFQNQIAHGNSRVLPHNEILPIDIFTWVAKLPLVNLKFSGGTDHTLEVQDISFALDRKLIEAISEYGVENLVVGYMPTDAMQPNIPQNAPIIIDQNDRVIREGVFVFKYGNYLQVKKLRPIGTNGIEIMSTNPEYPPEILTKDEANDIKIIGKVVQVFKGV